MLAFCWHFVGMLWSWCLTYVFDVVQWLRLKKTKSCWNLGTSKVGRIPKGSQLGAVWTHPCRDSDPDCFLIRLLMNHHYCRSVDVLEEQLLDSHVDLEVARCVMED